MDKCRIFSAIRVIAGLTRNLVYLLGLRVKPAMTAKAKPVMIFYFEHDSSDISIYAEYVKFFGLMDKNEAVFLRFSSSGQK
jgi:hypothetical protein